MKLYYVDYRYQINFVPDYYSVPITLFIPIDVSLIKNEHINALNSSGLICGATSHSVIIDIDFGSNSKFLTHHHQTEYCSVMKGIESYLRDEKINEFL